MSAAPSVEATTYYVQTDKESAASGFYWWYDEAGNPISEWLRRWEREEWAVIRASVITRKEAHRLFRKGLA